MAIKIRWNFCYAHKGNVLPDEQNKMETSGLSSTKIVIYCKLNKIFLERRKTV